MTEAYGHVRTMSCQKGGFVHVNLYLNYGARRHSENDVPSVLLTYSGTFGSLELPSIATSAFQL